MNAPAPLAAPLVALFLGAAALCAASLWRRRRRHEGAPAAAEANHVLMGVGMATMVLPATATVVSSVTGAVVFGVLAVAWGARLVALRGRAHAPGSPIGGDRCAAHPTHLLLSNAAMVVMYAAMVPGGAGMTGMPGMADMSGAHAGHGAAPPVALSALGAALAVYLLVHAALTVGALVRAPAPVATVAVTAGGAGAPSGPGGAVGRVVDSPAVQLGCQAVTGVGMALLLLVH